MKNYEKYNDYKTEVIESLAKEVEKQRRGYTIKKYYQGVIEYEGHTFPNTFDMVEINQNESIVSVYMVCTFQDYWNQYSNIVIHLELMKKQAKAQEGYMVFFDSKRELHCLSLVDMKKDKKPTIPFKEMVYSQFNLNELPSSGIIDLGNPISQFITILYGWCGELNGANLKLFFRGQPNIKYKPLPSIFRNKKSIENENIIYNEAIQRNPTEFTPDMTAFDNLVKMQHYELPTRLLDITSNPLVALYFACLEEKNDDGSDADGEVLVYLMSEEQIKYRDSDVICLLANLARRPKHFIFDAKKEIKQYKYLSEDVKNDRPTYNEDAMWNTAVHEVYCVLPKPNNDRIIKQDGAFFIFGMGETKDEPAELKIQPSRIIIKAEAKQMILNALNLLGINEASLFPETEKVMKQIKQEYCKS